MKKTIQFLFAMSILMEGQNSFAGTTEINATLDKAAATPMISTSKGIQYVIVTVMDDNYKPIAGASVAAPCTGQKAIITDENGNAQFNLPGACNCNGATAYISSPSCTMQIPLKCGADNEAICQ
jgi:hypothetical protein